MLISHKIGIEKKCSKCGLNNNSDIFYQYRCIFKTRKFKFNFSTCDVDCYWRYEESLYYFKNAILCSRKEYEECI